MSKYYIPSREEFFHGFLFEWKRDYEGSSDWKECDYNATTYFTYIKDAIVDSHVCPNCTYIQTDDSIPIYQPLNFLSKGEKWLKKIGIEIRVKYLDKEDIESLGFKNTKEENDGYFLTFEKDKSFTGEEIKLEYIIWLVESIPPLKDDPMVFRLTRIYKGEDLIFRGYIKNKSELIRVLKQLNID